MSMRWAMMVGDLQWRNNCSIVGRRYLIFGGRWFLDLFGLPLLRKPFCRKLSFVLDNEDIEREDSFGKLIQVPLCMGLGPYCVPYPVMEFRNPKGGGRLKEEPTVLLRHGGAGVVVLGRWIFFPLLVLLEPVFKYPRSLMTMTRRTVCCLCPVLQNGIFGKGMRVKLVLSLPAPFNRGHLDRPFAQILNKNDPLVW